MPLREKNFRNKSNLEFYLVMFNVISKNTRISDMLCLTFHLSKFLMLVEVTWVRLRKKLPRKKELLTQLKRMLIWSCFLENGTLFTPLLLFYLVLGLVCKKIYRFVQHTPMKCFKGLDQSAVNARREGDENPVSSVVAEKMKLLANHSYGYNAIDEIRHTVSKLLSDKKHMEPSKTNCLNVKVL